MALGLTWWGWSGLLVSVGLSLGLWARFAWRAAVRQELVDFLTHAAPDVAITDVHLGSLVYRGRNAADPLRTIALAPFYRQLGAHPGGTAEAEAARREVFAAVALRMRADIGRAPADAPAALRRAS